MEKLVIDLTVNETKHSFIVPIDTPPEFLHQLFDAAVLFLRQSARLEGTQRNRARSRVIDDTGLEQRALHAQRREREQRALVSGRHGFSSGPIKGNAPSDMERYFEAFGDAQPTASEVPVLSGILAAGGSVQSATDLIEYLSAASDFESRAKDPGGSIRYHLRNLVAKGLVERSEDDAWSLTSLGKEIVAALPA